MTTHRDKSKQHSLRRWFAEALCGSRTHFDSRRLHCEQLERRYAFHGLGWFESDSAYLDDSESTVVDDDGTTTQVAPMHAGREGEPSGNTETRFVNFFAVRYVASGEGVTSDDNVGSDEHPCNRPCGLTGEGEADQGLGAYFNRVPARGNNDFGRLPLALNMPNGDFSNKPEPKIVGSAPSKVGLDGMEPLKFDNSQHNVNAGLSSVVKEVVDSSHAVGTPSASLSLNSGEPKLSDFTGRGLGAITASNEVVITLRGGSSNSAASNTSQVSSRSSATPALISSKNEVATLATQNSLALRGSSNTSSLSEIASSSSHSSASAATNRTWQRNSAATASETVASADSETDNLRAQLDAVIDSLADEQTTRRLDNDSKLRSAKSFNGSFKDEDTSAFRQQSLWNNGMLELAATSERLSPVVASRDNVLSTDSDVHHGSQLIAALELSREFDLAGQPARSLKSVIDPTTKWHDASLVADEVGDWSEQLTLPAGSSAQSDDAESSIWQRSILPLSFLAISGMVIRHRLKRRSSTNS